MTFISQSSDDYTGSGPWHLVLTSHVAAYSVIDVPCIRDRHFSGIVGPGLTKFLLNY